jgi:hypothetical protein
MKMSSSLRTLLIAMLYALAFASSLFAGAPAAKTDGVAAPVVRATCHAAPQKFPPRMMATVLRHMRVRATVTAEDRRLILFYMTQ